jgi:cytochrome c oxidase subunit 2
MLEFLRLNEVSHIAGQVDSVFIFITAVGLFFFLLTQGCLIYFALRYRRKKKEEEAQTPYITGNLLLETVWVVIPSLLILAIFYYGYVVFMEIRTPPAGAPEIMVTAKQWLYQFKYPDGRQEINEVRVPVGKPVKFVMTSQDVLHGFYLPSFRVMQDIVPGRYTYLWLQPLKEGKYDIFCTQYCGTGHSLMRATIVVMSAKDYQEWLAGEAKEKAEPLSEQGEKLLEKSGCLTCHTTDGTPKIGPTFKGLFGSTQHFTDGTSAVADENYIRNYIQTPNVKVIKGFPPVMPTFKGILKDDDITAIIAYLKTLK